MDTQLLVYGFELRITPFKDGIPQKLLVYVCYMYVYKGSVLPATRLRTLTVDTCIMIHIIKI